MPLPWAALALDGNVGHGSGVSATFARWLGLLAMAAGGCPRDSARRRRAPRADFEIRRIDGAVASERSSLRLPWDENAGKLVRLQVKDPSGRMTWVTKAVHDEAP